MNTCPRRAIRRETVYRSWIEDPDLDPWQETHAVRGGDAVAVCGAETGAQGGAWPEFVTEWESPTTRCAVCARYVYEAETALADLLPSGRPTATCVPT